MFAQVIMHGLFEGVLLLLSLLEQFIVLPQVVEHHRVSHEQVALGHIVLVLGVECFQSQTRVDILTGLVNELFVKCCGILFLFFFTFITSDPTVHFFKLFIC